MSVPGSGEDFLDDRSGDDGDDFVEADGEDVTPTPPAPSQSPNSQSSSSAAQTARKRSVRVKPMPASMAAKWPKISTVLLTMNDGQQILLVKGG